MSAETPPFHTPSASVPPSALPSRSGTPLMDRTNGTNGMDRVGSTGTLRTMVPSYSASQATLHNGTNGTNGVNGTNNANGNTTNRQSLPPSGLGGIQEKEKPYSVPNPPPATHTVQLDTEPNRVLVAGKDQTPGEVDPALKPPKVNKKLEYVIKPMAIAATVLLIVLWATALWIFGCNHNAQHRAYKLKVSRLPGYTNRCRGENQQETSCGVLLWAEIAPGILCSYLTVALSRRRRMRSERCSWCCGLQIEHSEDSVLTTGPRA